MHGAWNTAANRPPEALTFKDPPTFGTWDQRQAPQSQHAAESGASKWLEFWSRLLLVMSNHLSSEAGKPDTLTGASAEARSRESDATRSEDGTPERTPKGAPCESDARECVRILKDDVLRALDRLDDLERLLAA